MIKLNQTKIRTTEQNVFVTFDKFSFNFNCRSVAKRTGSSDHYSHDCKVFQEPQTAKVAEAAQKLIAEAYAKLAQDLQELASKHDATVGGMTVY